MTHIQRSALVPRTPRYMYKLVDDVEAYPRRFDWCTAAEVLEDGEDGKVARLALRYAGMSTSFTTRNVGMPHSRIDLSLVEGPFSQLSGAWIFDPLGDAGCKVSLKLDFQMAGLLLGSALALGFQALADKLVDEFVKAAKA